MDAKYDRGPGYYPDGLKFSPDGLTEHTIDALLTEVDVVVMATPRPTSALMDEGRAPTTPPSRTALCAAAVVRALPVRGTAGGPGGWAA